MAEASTFADEIKSDNAYRRFSPWHYVNLPPDKKYDEVEASRQGDIVQGIEHCISVLRDRRASRADQAFYLRLLIHFIGDLHQPLHVGRLEDKGGNDLQVRWFDQGSNLHRVWDSNLIDSYGMSYKELSDNLPEWPKWRVRRAQQGSLLSWVGESQDLVNRVYASTERGEKLSHAYRYEWWNSLEEQLLVAGLRLAAVLNSIYA